jgi:hypothetical protein
LIVALADAHEIDMTSRLNDFFRANMLAGPTIDLPSSRLCLSVKSLDVFSEMLLHGYSSYFVTGAATDDFIKRVISGGELSTVEKEIDLSLYVQWCTFDPRGQRPFESDPETAEFYLASLGLPLHGADRRLLVFEYILPNDIAPRYPTICDGGLSVGFRPAPEFVPYGLSVPWSSNERVLPRPEAVHKAIKLKNVLATRLLN